MAPGPKAFAAPRLPRLAVPKPLVAGSAVEQIPVGEPVVARFSVLVSGVLDPIIAIAAQRKPSADDEIVTRAAIGDERAANDVVAPAPEHFPRTVGVNSNVVRDQSIARKKSVRQRRGGRRKTVRQVGDQAERRAGQARPDRIDDEEGIRVYADEIRVMDYEIVIAFKTRCARVDP